MSISNALSNALSGMNAASRTAEIVSSNVSNSLTDGYGRRSLNLGAASVGGQGAGVEIGTVHRHTDPGILSDRRLAEATLSEFETLVSSMGRIEDVIGSIGQGGSISSRIVNLESSLIDAAGDPSSSTRLSSLNDKLVALTDGLNNASKDIQTLRVEADGSIKEQVDLLNISLSQVAILNDDITRSRSTGNDPSALLDQRQVVIDKIASLIPIREVSRDGGQVALLTSNGDILLDGKAKVFDFASSPIITADMTIASGGLSGLTLDGDPVAADGIGGLTGGTLGAAFQIRDEELVTAQNGLDTIAADLIIRLEDTGADPTLAPGDAGLFTDNGSPYNAADIVGLAGRISVNAAVDPAQGGTLTNLRDGLNAITTGPSGDASLLQAISNALSMPINATNDPTSQSAAGRASSIEAGIGSQRLGFESELSFANARWSSLKEAEASGGVDTDYEMQVLLRVEQAYAANAKVIQAVETMIQRLLEI